MVYGPVTAEQNITKEGEIFLTDIIAGDEVVIQIIEPFNEKEKEKEKSALKISRVIHGYKNLFSTLAKEQIGLKSLGDAENCHNDIACFPAWLDDASAVALILLSNGNELCSGALLNNTAQNYKPYFLTAFHCIDNNSRDGNISASEVVAAENWMFKFGFKKTTCTNGYVLLGSKSYNRAYFIAGWTQTDFALMELRDNLSHNATWLGWDKSGNIPSSATSIHHPSGDVMKISFDTHQLSSSSWSGTNNHWLVNFDSGVVEHGSSGAPLFDQNKKIVGQLRGNQLLNNMPYCTQKRAEYGKFHLSWIGGGSDVTRLSDWLDPIGTGVSTINTINTPYIWGPDIICSSGSYSITNLPIGAAITWGVSSHLRITSTANNTLTVAYNSGSWGKEATITATIGNKVITKGSRYF